MSNLDGISKSRDITLSTKVRLVKAMVFPVVIYGCESWTIQKAERRRIDAFELVLEKTLESPLDSQEIKPVNPKGNQPCTLLVGMKNGAFVMKLSLKFPQKIKNRSNNTTSRFLY